MINTGYTSRNPNHFQAGTAFKSADSKTGYTFWNYRFSQICTPFKSILRNGICPAKFIIILTSSRSCTCQSNATRKNIFSNINHTLRNAYAGQCTASIKCSSANISHIFRNFKTYQAFTTRKHIIFNNTHSIWKYNTC